MWKLIMALLFGGVLAHAPAPPAANPATTTPARTNIDVVIDIAGPFETLEEADDYADFLEIEYGYETEIVEHLGLYYVIFG